MLCTSWPPVLNTETFAVSKTTVHRCVYAVCRAIQFKMLNQFVKLPNVSEAHLVPQVYGTLDGTHILILPPSDGYQDYVNHKRWPSIVLQALVDDQYQVCVGSPRSVRDAAAFTTSNLYR